MSTDPTEIFVQNLLTEQRLFGREMANNASAAAQRAADALDQSFAPPTADFLDTPVFDGLNTDNGTIRDLDDVNVVIDDIDVPDLLNPDDTNRGSLEFSFAQGLGVAPPPITATVGDHAVPAFPQRLNTTPPTIDTTVEFPDIPDLRELTRSELLTIELPEAPVIELPERTFDIPEFTGQVPEESADRYLSVWRSVCNELTDKIDAQLKPFMQEWFPNAQSLSTLSEEYLEQVLNGSGALPKELQEALYARAIERVRVRSEGQRLEAENLARETGNPVMPIRVRSNMLRISREESRQLTEVTVSIAEQQVQLELDQVRFVVTQAMSMRELALTARRDEIQLVLQTNSQAIQMADNFVGYLFRTFEAQVSVFQIQASLYELAIRELSSEREFILNKIAIFEGQVRVESLKTDINANLIRQDTLELDYEKANLETIETKIRALVAEFDLRKIPLEIFAEEVRAYTAYVNGVRGEVAIFEALVNADVQKIRAQIEQVRAWAEAKKVQNLELENQRFELDKIDSYNTAQLNAFRLQAQVKELQLRLAELQSNIQRENVASDRVTLETNTRLSLAEYEIENNLRVRTAELNARYAEAFERLNLEFSNLLQSRNNAIATIESSAADSFGRIGAAAMNGVNQLASINVTKTVDA